MKRFQALLGRVLTTQVCPVPASPALMRPDGAIGYKTLDGMASMVAVIKCFEEYGWLSQLNIDGDGFLDGHDEECIGSDPGRATI